MFGLSKELAKTFRCNIKFNDSSEYIYKKSIYQELKLANFTEAVTSYIFPSSVKLSTLYKFLDPEGRLSITISMSHDKLEVVKFDDIDPLDQQTGYVSRNEPFDISFRVFKHEECDNIDEKQIKAEDCNIVQAHKSVLSDACPWFEILFTNGMQESSQKMINIYGVRPNDFKLLIDYCYTNLLKLSDLNEAYKVLEMADRFQITELCEEAWTYIHSRIYNSNVWKIWEHADKYNNKKTAKACIAYISKNMHSSISNISFLDAKARYIRIAFDTAFDDDLSEESLYTNVLRWAKAQETITSKQLKTDLANILKSIRFTMLSLFYLSNCIETDDFIMSIHGVKKKLTHAYKYYAMKGTLYRFVHLPRNPISDNI
ncbi:MAG: hypothetical protein EXX96DRAFT_54778 [Benjaminiella poitrasii]|nr:MAG: hypothetical protein EXX96DRAFT_54778 [Benjaminiella poitrasii]